MTISEMLHAIQFDPMSTSECVVFCLVASDECEEKYDSFPIFDSGHRTNWSEYFRHQAQIILFGGKTGYLYTSGYGRAIDYNA